jgi:cellulose synthase (UDP-forming)
MSAIDHMKRTFLKDPRLSKSTLVACLILTLAYFVVITFAFQVGDYTLFTLLIIGEVFHVFQVVMYLHTVWNTSAVHHTDDSYLPTVDVFVTVAGEPVDIVAETLRAINGMNYPSFKAYVLNDGYVAKKENWKDIEILAKSMGIGCVTRTVPGGAKAGNINNGLRETGGEGGSELVVVFDADHVPHADFLRKTVPYFADPKVAFVQSPQYYKNFALNYVTRSAWEQQELFFGPICRGKDSRNCATMCGTNMVIRRRELIAVGGMSETSIAEDFLTGLLLHRRGLKSVYVPEVLAEGLAPEDFLSYTKQQFRWARGALDVIFGGGLFSGRGLTMTQRLQYFSSVSFYLSGFIVVLNALIPIVYFYTGRVPFLISTMTLATFFLPYIFLTLYVLQRSSNNTFTFRALLFSMSGFAIHIKAFWAAVTRQKSAFVVTPKRQQTGNFIGLVIPHIAYIVIAALGIGIAFAREGLSASLVTNSAWALLNVGIFVPFIYAALPDSMKERISSIGARPKRVVAANVRNILP